MGSIVGAKGRFSYPKTSQHKLTFQLRSSFTMESKSTFEKSYEYYKELMEIDGVSWIVYTAVLICLVLTAVYIVGWFRNLAIGGHYSHAEEDLDLIREIRNRDMIADEEFDRAKQLIRKSPTKEIPSKEESPAADADQINE